MVLYKSGFSNYRHPWKKKTIAVFALKIKKKNSDFSTTMFDIPYLRCNKYFVGRMVDEEVSWHLHNQFVTSEISSTENFCKNNCQSVRTSLQATITLHVWKQVAFCALCTIVHRCLYGDAPSYLVDLITPSAAASARTGLRTAESMTVAVPCTLSLFGHRSYAPAGLRAWNKLPSHLHLIQSGDTFRRHLKTFFSPGIFIMTLLGTLVVLLHLHRRNLDLL